MVRLTWSAMFESVGDVWLWWLLSLAVATYGVYRGLRHFHWRTLRRFWADETGASYTLAYVMTFPIYLLVVVVMIQASLILMVKYGNMYAAYAAARSAIVWRGAHFDDAAALDNAHFRAGRAAIMAMTPFASGYARHREVAASSLINSTAIHPLLVGASLTIDKRAYEAAYRRMARANGQTTNGATSPVITTPNALAKRDYVLNKYEYATIATRVQFNDAAVPWNEGFAVTVTHRMPMHVPGAGRILGSAWPSSLFPRFFYRDVSTTVTLPSEAPQTDDHLMNIPYNPEFFRSL